MEHTIDIKFKLNESLYNRDPQDTDLGRKIIKHSIELMDEIGFEAFTFKKLAHRISSTEKSVYRYFENKHFLLLFLTSWYWEWVHYLISSNTRAIQDPRKQLDVVIENIVYATSENLLTTYVNENLLHKIIINEGSKSYHTCSVDAENKAGLFLSYKLLVEMVVKIIKRINPKFKYATSLSSNLFEMANNQIYFAQHLPRLTSIQNSKKSENELIKMLILFSEKLLSP